MVVGVVAIISMGTVAIAINATVHRRPSDHADCWGSNCSAPAASLPPLLV